MKRNHKFLWSIAALALAALPVVLASCGRGGAGALGNGAAKAELGYATEAAASSPNDALPTVVAEAATLDSVLRLTGTLEPDEKSDVASTADGILLDVRIERGSLVEKGDVLAMVDPRDVKNALDQGNAAVAELKAALGWDDSKGPFQIDQHPGVKAAKADMDLAKTSYDRVANLFKSNAVSKQMLDQSSAQYEMAQQKHQQAQLQANQLYQSYNSAMVRVKTLNKALEDTTIVAPFSGWVATKFVSAGERVTTNPMGVGAKIVTLVKIDPMRLVLSVPQQYAAQIQVDQQVSFTVEALPGKTFSGRVKYFGPSLEMGSRSLTIEALVPNPDKALRPGFFVSAELTLPEKRECVAIPASAIVKSGEVSTVYVLQDHQAIPRIVAVDETREDRAYIKSGLAAGDKVITDPAKIAKTAEAPK